MAVCVWVYHHGIRLGFLSLEDHKRASNVVLDYFASNGWLQLLGVYSEEQQESLGAGGGKEMICEIVTYPDSRLKERSAEITFPLSDEDKEDIRDMIETADSIKEAVGIAAVQIGVQKRIFIMNEEFVSGNKKDKPRIFINPEIEMFDPGEEKKEEYCLSFPGIGVQITRRTLIKVLAKDIEGKQFEVVLTEFAARAAQHEMDHLNGVLLIDHVGTTQREIIKKKLKKMQKMSRTG